MVPASSRQLSAEYRLRWPRIATGAESVSGNMKTEMSLLSRS
jgi:hypothetical protein